MDCKETKRIDSIPDVKGDIKFYFSKYSEKLNLATTKIDKEIDIVLSNSFGFGGTNSALVLKKFK